MAWNAPLMYRRARRVVAVASALVVVLVVLSSTAASATWSIVAVEPETGRVGAVMASCIDPGILGDADKALVPIVIVPGAGVGVVQGTLNWDAPDELRSLLQDDVSAADSVNYLLSGAFEANPNQDSQIRQYGVVAFAPDAEASQTSPGELVGNEVPQVEMGELSAVFTGEEIEGERQAVAGKNVAAQGLLMPDKAVINDTLTAYAVAVDSSQTLEQALVDGLVAGSRAGGDQRCGNQTALFAQLVVAEPGDDPLEPSTLLTVTVDEGDGQNPVLLLSDAFDQGQRGWIDAGQRSSVGVSKVWAAVVTGIVAVIGIVLVRKGMGNTAATR